MSELKDENGKIWDITSAGTLAQRHRNRDVDGVRHEETQKLMYTPEGEFFILTTGQKIDAAEGGVWQPYETVTSLSSDEAVRELDEGKDWTRTT